MRSSPRVSVVMPAYNRAALLPQAIDSVLAQTFDDFELIVVDDGSTDGTREVVGGYGDARLRYVRRPENGGISAALNTGLAAATGALIARLDSDDVWLPEFLETQATALDGAPQAGFVYAKGTPIDAGGRPIPGETVGRAPRFPGDAFASLLLGDCTCNITVVARREAMDEAGPFDESLRFHEDWDMWLRVARLRPMAFTDRVLAHFRWHGGNATAPQGPHFDELIASRGRVLDKQFGDPTLTAEHAALRGPAYSEVHLEMGVRLWTNGRRREALRRYARSIGQADRKAAALCRTAWLGFLRVPVLSTAPGRAAVERVRRLVRRSPRDSDR